MGKAIIPTDAEIEAIRIRSEAENACEIRAVQAVYHAGDRTLALTLAGRAAEAPTLIRISIDVEPQLAALTDTQLAQLDVYPGGTTLACDAANLHLSVEALVFRTLMGPDYHARLRKLGAAAMGRTSSEAKAAAVRANGTKGGRPRKAKAAG